MILATLLDVALCAAVTLGVVVLCVVGHFALVGRDTA